MVGMPTIISARSPIKMQIQIRRVWISAPDANPERKSEFCGFGFAFRRPKPTDAHHHFRSGCASGAEIQALRIWICISPAQAHAHMQHARSTHAHTRTHARTQHARHNSWHHFRHNSWHMFALPVNLHGFCKKKLAQFLAQFHQILAQFVGKLLGTISSNLDRISRNLGRMLHLWLGRATLSKKSGDENL